MREPRKAVGRRWDLTISHQVSIFAIYYDVTSHFAGIHLLLLTFPGAPSIYYGDEVGLEGALDPDSRRGFPEEAQWNLDILDCHRQLIGLRHARMSLRVGEYRLLGAEGMMYVFARLWEGDVLVIAVNPDDHPATIDLLSVAGRLHAQPRSILYCTDKKAEESVKIFWTDDNLFLKLPPRTGIILG